MRQRAAHIQIVVVHFDQNARTRVRGLANHRPDDDCWNSRKKVKRGSKPATNFQDPNGLYKKSVLCGSGDLKSKSGSIRIDMDMMRLFLLCFPT